MSSILTVTLNPSVDTTLTIPSPFMVGETNRVEHVLKLPGGKGINVARVLHTLGVPVQVSGLAGGPAGEFLRTGLAEVGIPSTFLPITGASRTCTAVVERASHRVTEINEPGPTITETEAQAFLDLYERLLPGALAVVLSGSLPLGLPDDYYTLLLHRAQAAGVSCILDTSDGPLRLGLSAHPLLVKPNAAESEQFLGKEVHSVEDAVGVGQSMRKQGAQMVAVTRGGEGAVLVTEMGSWVAGLQVANPLSGVGSGDAFVAGFIAGLLRAVELREATSLGEAATDARKVVQALMLAMACGAANTLMLGAGVLNRDDVERFSPMVNVTALA
jgi:1-phosphofructokinase family hexose kinase